MFAYGNSQCRLRLKGLLNKVQSLKGESVFRALITECKQAVGEIVFDISSIL